MNLTRGQQYLGWAILAACLISIPVGFLGRSKPAEDDRDSEKLSGLLSNKDRIVVVRIGGMIHDDEGGASLFPDPDSSIGARKRIRKAIKNEKARALLLRINSPGGTVGTSQEVYDAVRDFKAKGRPVYVSMGDVAASGGYYISAAADKIYAQPGTITGSIGVIMHTFNLSEVQKKIGVQPVVIKSGAFKDIGSMDRPMTPEEQKLLQTLILDSYDQFVTAVSEGRKMDKEAVKKLADGRIFTGRQAKQARLVDELGGFDAALADLQKTTKEKFGLKADLYVDDGRARGLLGALLEARLPIEPPSASSLIQQMLPKSYDPQFLNQPLWLKE